MSVRFTKMHGLGNDYLYVYGEAPENAPELSVKLSDRHFGAGSDGMIYISGSDTADFKMRIFNADGSEAKMCGNGIRCVGKYVYDKGLTDKTELTVETLSGIKRLSIRTRKGKAAFVTVSMGKTEVSPDKTVCVNGEEMTCVPVSVGNPHAVFFVEDAEAVPLETIGPAVEHHPEFPGGVNAEFVQVISGKELRMRVWERGSGVTMACGTGSCASVAAAVSRGLCRPGEEVTVVLDGGRLLVSADAEGCALMTGPAETVYEGETAE